MGTSGLSVALALLGILITGVAYGGSGPIKLRQVKPVAHGIAAFPQIVVKRGDSAAERINRALAHANASGGCKDWHRNVGVTMRGPRYLSVVAYDDWYCGGPYPDTETTALVYDLTSGQPIDWNALLPKSLAGKAAPDPGGGASDPIYIDSPGLWALFVKTANKPGDDCDEVRTEHPDGSFDARLMLWPDAKEDGIEIDAAQFPHVIKACAGPVTIPTAELRKLGVDAALLDAIDEAHAKGWFDGGKNK